jgi:hypothetical protein
VVRALGIQEPRILWVPRYKSSLGEEAIEIAQSAGLVPDPWQEHVITNALGVRKDGKWAAFEVGLNVPRQNGKGGILEMRELAGIFLFGERLIIHSAHEFATANEAFRRMEYLLEESGLHRELKPRSGISRSHGDEGFVFKSGQRIRYRTRTKGGGRGFTADCLILDEAMYIAEFAHGALLPTLSARSEITEHGVQVWYTGSAVDQQDNEDGVVFARIRERGIKGDDPSLAYFEWSVDDTNEKDEALLPEQVPTEVLEDEKEWARANPALGVRISSEHIGHEFRSMDIRTFAVERLGIGDWPITDSSLLTVINMDLWKALTDADSKPLDPVCFAYDVSPSRTSGAIGVGGRREDGRIHVEIIEHGAGTGWIVPRLVELSEKHSPFAIVCDGASPAAALIDELMEKDIEVEAKNANDQARACGVFYDLVDQEGLRHLGTAELVAALRGAKQRPLGDAWAWSRKNSKVDITPLVAVTLAAWQATLAPTGEPAFAFS